MIQWHLLVEVGEERVQLSLWEQGEGRCRESGNGIQV